MVVKDRKKGARYIMILAALSIVLVLAAGNEQNSIGAPKIKNTEDLKASVGNVISPI